MPLLTRRYERHTLLIPYLLVNLMSDYQYQHDIFFQYTYGATGCLIYLTLINLADIRLEPVRIAAAGVAAVIGFSCFAARVLPKVNRYTDKAITYSAYYQQLRQVLDTVPEDVSVAATTYYTTYYSRRDALYDVRYSSLEHMLGCEYVVVGVTDTNGLKKFNTKDKSGYENLVELLLEEGYTLTAAYEGKLEVYRRK
jgi:hypothetical protein